MDYKKKYNEALKWMRELYPGLHGATKEDAEHYFPELRESEDERIRKEIIEYLKLVDKGEGDYAHPMVSGWIAWLEKQKEQKPSTPKFRVGDVMRTKQEAAKGITDGLPVIVSVDDNYYYCTNEKIPISEQEEYEFPPMNMRQKPAEWSEDDERMLQTAIEACETVIKDYTYSSQRFIDCKNRLKSLRPSWKPSEEQMNALRKAVNKLAKTDVADSVRLSIMYDNLQRN